MVSFVALLAGVGSGHAAIPSTEYVNQGLETKVDDTQVVAKAGDAELATYAAGVQAGTVNVDSAQNNNIANVNAVAANFVPNIAATLYDRGRVMQLSPDTEMPDGAYSLIVEVKDGKISYRWVALDVLSQYGDGTCSTTGCEG